MQVREKDTDTGEVSAGPGGVLTLQFVEIARKTKEITDKVSETNG